ncbi:FHA domain-containing protein [Georgenia sunbinii]|uniref:FHA domain-containing protein n=1 Tax=Georgenia sunbinii TaxID=3117728 RepID=UPI002F2691A4
MRGSRLISRAVWPYLGPEVTGEPPGGGQAPHSGLVSLRHEALDVLADEYRSPVRLAVGALAWLAVAAGGAVAVLAVTARASWGSVTSGVVLAAGVLVLALGGWLGWSVLRAGRTVARAAARWLRVPAPTPAAVDAHRLRRAVVRRAVLGGLTLLAVAAPAAVMLLVLPAAVGGVPRSERASLALAGGSAPGAVAFLGLVTMATAVAAIALLGGIGRLADAAWQRPTVTFSRPSGPALWLPPAVSGGAPAPEAAPAERRAPPTVEIDLRRRPTLPTGPPVLTEAGVPVQGAPAVTTAVVLPDGTGLRPGVTLVGRQPARRPQDVAIDDYAVLSERTVSKTHAALVLGEDGLLVVDRASTNGTLVEDAAGTLVRCRPWLETPVAAPATLHLGGARLQVRSVATPADPSRGSYEVA